MRETLGDSVSAEDAAEKFPNLARAYKVLENRGIPGYGNFVREYALFAAAAKRVEEARTKGD